jgi:pimeloyl-ACP methyl ester carboxylesterase
MIIRIIALPSRRSRLLTYLLCLLISLPTGAAFGQNKTVVPCDPSASAGVSGAASDNLGPLKQEAATALDSSLPIVFVPGTAGSELRLTNEKISCANWKYRDDLLWLGLSTIKKNCILAAKLNKDGRDFPENKTDVPNVLTAFSVPLAGWVKRFITRHLGYAPSSYDVDVYADFLSWAYKTFGRDRFHVAPYDWRKGASKESFEAIQKAVDKATKGVEGKRVILLAHSLGGLVSRDYIVQTEGKQVAALIAVGTPWLGTPKAARALLWGYNFDIGIVEHSDRTKKIRDLPKDFVTDVCKNSKCQALSRLSFLKRESVRELSRDFPGVYLQLPTSDFMVLYGSYYGQPSRSIIWDMDTWDKVESFYRDDNNGTLYKEAMLWRKRNLNGEAHGVRHYLIGGVYNPACKDKTVREKDKSCDIGNRMDMQMPLEKRVPGASRLRKFGIFFWDLLASLLKSDAYDDPFVALDSAYEWGDGTSPLLSATAGEYIRGGDKPCQLARAEVNSDEIRPCYPGKAKEYLGEKTKVEAVKLGSRYGHSAMLNDPQIKRLLLKFYETENGHLPTDIGKPDEDIHSISIEFTAEDNDVNNEVITKFIGAEGEVRFLEPQKTHLLVGTRPRPILFENPKILDSELWAPRDRNRKGDKVYFRTGAETSDCRSVYRTLRMSDLKDMFISFMRRNQSSRNLVINSVTLVVNDKRYPLPKSDLILSRSNTPEQIPIPDISQPHPAP